MKKLCALLLMTHTCWGALGLSLDGGVGFRKADFSWTIGDFNNNPDIVSELEWNNLKAVDYYARGTLPYMPCKTFGFELHYSPLNKGTVTDTDFLGSGRTLEYSRSVSNANKGYLVDLILSSDWTIPILGSLWMITPSGGYCYHRQHLSLIDGELTNSLDPSLIGPIEGLDSRYTTLWRGVYVGIESTNCLFGFTAKVGGRYHWLNYRATGEWNLIEEIMEPFSHRANGGWGVVYYADLKYYLFGFLGVGVRAQWDLFRASNGKDRTLVDVDGKPVEHIARLNNVKWKSSIYNLVLSVSF